MALKFDSPNLRSHLPLLLVISVIFVLTERFVPAEEPGVAGSTILVDPGAPGLDTVFDYDNLVGPDSEEAVGFGSSGEYLQEGFVRPGYADPGSSLVPFRAAQRLAKGIRATMETGFGYDSNTQLNNGGYSSPTHPDIGHKGGAVSWFRFGVGYSSGVNRSAGQRIIYGFDFGGDIISYGSGENDRGRDAAEPYFSPFITFVGGKTTVKITGSYDLSEGNYLFSQDSRREAPTAEAQTYGFNVAVTREMTRGTLGYVFSYLKTDFDANTFLNDQHSAIHDLSYLHDPLGMPKTSLGGGLRFGGYDTARNADESFFEPSFRLSHAATAKTSLDGRFGYMFRDNSDPAADGGEYGRFTYALGMNWNMTERTRLRLEGYRDFSPSFVSAGESFDSDGIRVRTNYASPFWRLSMSAFVGYERADYYSNYSAVASSGRRDGYFTGGVNVGRPVNISRWVDTSVSLFYDYSENDTNDSGAAYDRHFTGLRFTGSL
ncbi:MAG: hypothetical protein P1U81_07425 [Verrucomicrobiales bacterium]|nr:hypothetical protein [Verrucomicrobiales bacterium]